MAELLPHQRFVRIGSQADRTTTNDFNSSDLQSDWFNLATSPDGLSGSGNLEKEPIPTQHKVRGAKYIVQRARNTNGLSVSMPLFPEHTKFMLDSVLATDANDKLTYHTVEEFYDVSLDNGGDGKKLLGCVFNDLSFSVDRSASQTITPTWSGFLNQDTELTSGVPSYTAPALSPYDSLHAFIDLQSFTAGGSATWAGDNADVRSIEFSFSQGAVTTDPRLSTTATLDRSWTNHHVGIPTLTLSASLVVTDSEYLNYLRSATPKEFGCRIMFWHPEASYTDTTAAVSLSTSAATTIVPAGGISGLAVGDKVLLTNADLTKVNVMDVDAIDSSAGTFAVDDGVTGGADVATSSEVLTVKNGAFMLKMDRFDVQVGDPTTADNVVVVPLTLTAQLTSSGTALVTSTSYNDDNS